VETNPIQWAKLLYLPNSIQYSRVVYKLAYNQSKTIERLTLTVKTKNSNECIKTGQKAGIDETLSRSDFNMSVKMICICILLSEIRGL
jgi:hypothetical protein